MNRIHSTRAIAFVCFLVLIASTIYFFKHQHDARLAGQRAALEQEKANAEAKIKANQDAAAAAIAAREKRLADINTNIVRETGVEMIAVACGSEAGTMNAAISDALATHFAKEHVKFVSSFFRPTVVANGTFNALFAGSKEVFNRLELEKTLDGLLLAKQSVQYSKNEALDGVITADMHLQIVTLPVTAQIESQSWTLSAKGTGFNNADARMQAEERIIKQINNSTNMSLRQINSNH